MKRYKAICGCGYERTVKRLGLNYDGEIIKRKCPACGDDTNWDYEIVEEERR